MTHYCRLMKYGQYNKSGSRLENGISYSGITEPCVRNDDDLFIGADSMTEHTVKCRLDINILLLI